MVLSRLLTAYCVSRHQLAASINCQWWCWDANKKWCGDELLRRRWYGNGSMWTRHWCIETWRRCVAAAMYRRPSRRHWSFTVHCRYLWQSTHDIIANVAIVTVISQWSDTPTSCTYCLRERRWSADVLRGGTACAVTFILRQPSPCR